MRTVQVLLLSKKVIKSCIVLGLSSFALLDMSETLYRAALKPIEKKMLTLRNKMLCQHRLYKYSKVFPCKQKEVLFTSNVTNQCVFL